MRLSASKGAEILQIASDLCFSTERYRYDGSLKRTTAFATDLSNRSAPLMPLPVTHSKSAILLGGMKKRRGEMGKNTPTPSAEK
jgi:hypothetical protein